MEWKTDGWFGNAFQTFEATDENDLEAAMVVLHGGMHLENDEEERSARVGKYLGMRDERLDRMAAENGAL